MTPIVLVVDDEDANRRTLERILVREGLDVRHAPDGETALQRLGQEDIWLMLTDLKMPGMDGLSLLAELRRREFRAPCILLSAFLNDDLRCQAAHLGVARILEKPVGVRILRRALDELLPLETGRPAKAAG